MMLSLEQAWDKFTANFTLYVILFITPFLILLINGAIRKRFKLPTTAGADWLLFLITFDIIALLTKDMQSYVSGFYQDHYVAVFVVLLLFELYLLFRFIMVVEKEVVYHFFSDRPTRNDISMVNALIMKVRLPIKRFLAFASVWFLFVYTVYIFIAK